MILRDDIAEVIIDPDMYPSEQADAILKLIRKKINLIPFVEIKKIDTHWLVNLEGGQAAMRKTILEALK